MKLGWELLSRMAWEDLPRFLELWESTGLSLMDRFLFKIPEQVLLITMRNELAEGRISETEYQSFVMRAIVDATRETPHLAAAINLAKSGPVLIVRIRGRGYSASDNDQELVETRVSA